jgi:hypothetical protein
MVEVDGTHSDQVGMDIYLSSNLGWEVKEVW